MPPTKVATTVVPQAQPLTIAEQLDVVVQAIRSGAPTLNSDLTNLDTMYKAGATQANASFVDQIARRLLQDPALLDNLNFHTTMLDGRSNFLKAVLECMRKISVEEPASDSGMALVVRIRLVEHLRRVDNYTEMNSQAMVVEESLRERVGAGETLALRLMAKVVYERSMAAYQQKQFEQAIALSSDSASLCARAGDLYGELAARGNSVGLFVYGPIRQGVIPAETSLTALTDSKVRLQLDLATADTVAKKEDIDPFNKTQLLRVMLNNAVHLINIADLTNDPDLARRMLTSLESNPLYWAAFDPSHPREISHAEKWIRDLDAMVKQVRLPGQ